MMSLRATNILGAPAGPLVLVVLVLAAAVLAGMVTAVIGTLAGSRAAYYLAVLGIVFVGGIVTVTRKEPLRFAFLALIACFPIAATLVPLGRIGLMVFNVVMFALTVGLLGKRLFASAPASVSLFPTRSLMIAWLLSVPCVVFSQYPLLSLAVFILINFTLYAFFLYTLDELSRERGFERLVLLLSIVMILMALGVFVDRFLHLNLSTRSMVGGGALNQSSYAAGIEIYRAAGFFVDPQGAGAFLASLITFLLLLAIRGRFRGMKMRFVVWAAIAVGLVALVGTISRVAMLACILVSGLALFAFNRWNAAVKLAITGSVLLVVAGMALTPVETWLDVVPAAIAERFATLRTDFEFRREVWFDTWNMFADHPMTGIGLGSFQPYLIETRPTIFNHYGIGAAAGIEYIPSQAENGYLTILYEGGIAGSIAVLLVAGDAVRRAIGVIAGNNTDSDARTEGIAALAGLITFGATFVTLFTVSDARIGAIFAFMLAVIWHRSLERERGAPKA